MSFILPVTANGVDHSKKSNFDPKKEVLYSSKRTGSEKRGQLMKKGVFLGILLLCAAVTVFPIIRITVTIQPYYLILKALETENVEVRRLIDASQNPHTFSPSVTQVKLLYDSNIILYNGLHLESYLESTLASFRSSGKTVIAASDFLSQDRLLAGHSHAGKDHASESPSETDEGFNPHIWLDPVFLCEAIIPGLRDLLIAVDPINQTHYLSISQQMITSIEAQNLEMKTYLSDYSGKTVLMSHPSFLYFFERYGLILESIFEGEGDEPTAGEMKALIDGLKQKRVVAMFMEPQQPQRYVEILSKEGKIGIGTLDPLGWNAASISELLSSNFAEIKRVFP